MPNTSANSEERSASSTVAGTRSRSRSATGRALAVRHAELAARHVAHEVGELDRERIVEAEPLGKLGALLQRGFLSDHVGDRIADEAEHREREQRHGQHHHDGLGEAAQDVGDHELRATMREPSS